MARIHAVALVASSFGCSAAQSVPQFSLMQWDIAVNQQGSNAYNVSALGTYVQFSDANGVATRIVPFLTQNFTRSQSANGSEILQPAGTPYYAVRFAPTVLGEYTYQQVFTPANASLPAINGSFTCTTATVPDGYVHVDSRNGRYFTIDDATAFWLVGENMAWPGVWPYFANSSLYSNGTGGTYMYDRYLTKLAGVGGNYIRLWIGPSLIQEPVWDGEEGSLLDMSLMSQTPFGTYNLAAAWRIDYVVELARRLGVKITMVIDAQQACCEPGTWCFWNVSTYNVANGGPLQDCSDVWTNPATVAELHQRWQYILARWAYSTSIFSWELANENDDWAGWGPAAVATQLDIAAMLAASDAWHHMIDDSFGNPGTPQPDIEGSPLIAFTSAHAYDDPDFAALVWSNIPSRVEAWRKPAFLQEFGASWQGPLEHELDPTGISIHNAAWASLVGGGAGTGMQWWWNEMDALDTYAQLAGVATFARNISQLLLQYNFSTWNPAVQDCASGHAGWIVGMDEVPNARAALFWVYNRNHTWFNMHGGGVVVPITACNVTLRSLPLSANASATVQWINTTTGFALSAPQPADMTGGDVTLRAPAFITDVAALVVMA